jgi:Domain of unknown function (DUF4159)
MPKLTRMAWIASVLSITAAAVWAQAVVNDTTEATRGVREAAGEFQFVRLAYSSNSYGSGGWGRRQMWQTDWPDAEQHFSRGIDRLTRVAVADQARILTPSAADIFDYPWIYAVEVGYWYLDAGEAAHIREYLLRGGFLMVDDFHTQWEWSAFVASMERVFPDRPIVEIQADDEVFHVVYDLDQSVQIPSRMVIYSGVTWERDGYTPHWRGIYDDEGRLMVVINFNMDIGDAWEHADWPDYPENMTALAYRFGINYLIYAMTH